MDADSDSLANEALAGLLATITDKRIRRKVQKLLQLGEESVRALGEIDAALYLREDGETQLQLVADAVLSHFRRLMEYATMVTPPAGTDPPKLDPSRTMIPHRDRTDDERWNALSGEMVTLQFGLGSELKEFERRFSIALKNDRKEQAVRDLNDATSGLMDGVFAVMTTVYECFLGYAEPERMVPGHRDRLGKCLAIRRAVAELRRVISGLNARLQDRASSTHHAETAFRDIIDEVNKFIESDVFFYLRSDTRADFMQFRETLVTGNFVQSRLDCEGFDKYLDSLAFVSQRGVLIKHDTDLKVKITGDLERAIKFAALLPDVVYEVIEQAFVKGERLYGLSDQIDDVVERWFSLTDASRDVEVALALGRELLELVRPAPVRASSEGDDFF